MRRAASAPSRRRANHNEPAFTGWRNLGAVPGRRGALDPHKTFRELSHPPEGDGDRRDYMMAEPLKMDSAGNIVLGDWLGMGYGFAEGMLVKTRTG